MLEKFDAIGERSVDLLKYCYLIHTIIFATNIFGNSSLTDFTSLFVIFFGSIALLYRLIHIKDYKSYPFLIMYVLIVASFILSAVLNLRFGYRKNIKIVIWMMIQYGLLYMFDLKKDEAKENRVFDICSDIMIIGPTVFSFASLVMLMTNYCTTRVGNTGVGYTIGVAYWGRLYGAFADPNYSSTMCTVAILAAAYKFLTTDKKSIKAMTIIASVNPVQVSLLHWSASRCLYWYTAY